ncbi:MAG: hypothetical protein PHX80_05370 [Candidatus Nanoarchaeia archaeon]|nr:hypothetical protein [Candidatus Nanoarchaeia archaeon]
MENELICCNSHKIRIFLNKKNMKKPQSITKAKQRGYKIIDVVKQSRNEIRVDMRHKHASPAAYNTIHFFITKIGAQRLKLDKYW